MRARNYAILSFLAVLAAAPVAPAATAPETLDLVCKVHETRAGGAHRDIRRRLELDLQARTVRFSDDTGQGWRFKRQYTFLSADADRIRLESSEGKESYVDRRTGLYYFHNTKGDLTIRGPCRKTAAEAARF